MNETQFKTQAKKAFNDVFGITLHDIPKRDDIQTPDFEVLLEDERTLIELKTKTDDPVKLHAEMEKLKTGEIVTKAVPLSPWNTLSGIIDNAVEQFESFDTTGNAYRVIWFHCEGQDPAIQRERVVATLFGTESVFSINGPSRWCYYFYDSAFYRCKGKLDGALITAGKKLQLCINSVSPRLDQFQNSRFAQRFSNALLHPAREESSGSLIADFDVDRKDKKNVLELLKKKYGFDHLQVISLSSFSGTIAVNK